MKTISFLTVIGMFFRINAAWSSALGAELDVSLGERSWLPVTNGLVFIDGEYIAPPYIISRVESSVYLNGRYLESPVPWPPKKAYNMPVPENDPVMPSSITENTTKYDKEYIQYISEKRAYLFSKYGQEKGIDMMVKVYRGLPIVLDAEREPDSPWTIHVKWKSGEESHIGQVPHKRNDLTKEQADEMLTRFCEIYAHGLENNNYFMLGSTMGRRGTPESFARTLVPLANAMRTAKDEAEFLAIMKTNQPPGGMSEAAFRAFYRHRDDLPKWEPRVREAVEKERR